MKSSSRSPEWATAFLIAISTAGFMLQDPLPEDPMRLTSLRAQHTARLLEFAEADSVGPFAPMAMMRNMPEWRVRVQLGEVQQEVALDAMDPVEDLFTVVQAAFAFPRGVGLYVVRPQGEYELIAGTPQISDDNLLLMDDFCADNDPIYCGSKKRARHELNDAASLLASIGDLNQATSIMTGINTDPAFLVHEALMQASEFGFGSSAMDTFLSEESDDLFDSEPPLMDPLTKLKQQMQQLQCDDEIDSATRDMMISLLSEQMDEICTIRKFQKTGGL